MTLLACNIERTASIPLYAHGGVCGVVCVNIHACLCVRCAWCVVVCTCALVCATVSAPSKWWIQVYKYTISNHTSTKQQSYSFGNCLLFFLLQLTQCDVTVCTYNVVYIELRSKHMVNISLHMLVSTISVHMQDRWRGSS